jgi:hypothetical protein
MRLSPVPDIRHITVFISLLLCTASEYTNLGLARGTRRDSTIMTCTEVNELHFLGKQTLQLINGILILLSDIYLAKYRPKALLSVFLCG